MKRRARHFLVVIGICAGCALLALALWWKGFVPFQQAENMTRDLRARLGRHTPIDDRLKLIGIDRPFYETSYFDEWEVEKVPAIRGLFDTYPWRRDVWAEIITRLADAGAKAIVIDLVFAAPKAGDDALKAALDKYRDQVVIGCNLGSADTERGGLMQIDLPNPGLIEPEGSRSVVEDDRVGYVNIWTDFDTVFRSARYRATGDQIGNLFSPDTILESLDARALRKFGRADLIPPGYEPRFFRYTAPAGYGYVPLPIGEVISPKLWKKNFRDGEDFRGKIVLIGPTANLFQDKHHIPLVTPDDTRSSEMPGPEIHLNIINAALHGEFLREPPVIASALMICAAGLLAAALSFSIRQPVKRLIFVVATCAGYWFLAQWLFDHNGLLLLVAVPLLVLAISSITALSYDFVIEQLDKIRVRKTLERYVSKNVVKELLDNPETYFNSLGGVRRNVTILFSDVRGFTTLTESADSHELVKQLNEYFERMVRHVFESEGSLDKFIGDAVMAVWGNIVSHGDAKDACHAVATAMAMKKSLVELNVGWKERKMLDLSFGIGINHGEVIVGNLGSTEKMELTVIGDAVNLASRLEGLTKEYHLDLLLGEKTAPLVRDQFLLRTVDCVQVKGKTKGVDVFTVIEGQVGSSPPWLARYEDGVALYRARKFAEAAAPFEESQRLNPDYITEMYLKRCAELVQNPPDDNWNGVFIMTKK